MSHHSPICDCRECRGETPQRITSNAIVDFAKAAEKFSTSMNSEAHKRCDLSITIPKWAWGVIVEATIEKGIHSPLLPYLDIASGEFRIYGNGSIITIRKGTE